MQLLSQRAAADKERVDIHQIIGSRSVCVCFQQIVSVARNTVCGIEGLIRGVDMETGELLPPSVLFDAANREGVTLALDRLCRDKVLEAFSCIHKRCTDKLLFINVDTSILDRTRSNYLMGQVNANNINPGNIVIEINETKVRDDRALKLFIDTYRERGFLIALDDIGAGFSNLDRIPLAKPDIIKIDMTLVRHIHQDYYKQVVFTSLISLAKQIGAVVIAEGIETEQEAIQTLQLGANMIQGFYFSRPVQTLEDAVLFCTGRIRTLGECYKTVMNQRIIEEKKYREQIAAIANNAVLILASGYRDAFDKILIDVIRSHCMIECAYVLDEKGGQVSNTVFSPNEIKENLIFYSAKRGDDHAMKRYFYQLKDTHAGGYMTDPYVSLATGNLCVTFSEAFQNTEQQTFILCMDLHTGCGKCL